MSHHQDPSHIARVFVACSPTYRNRRALMEALGSIFLDTIEGQREYYYFECPAMTEIFDDGVFGPQMFRRLAPGDVSHANTIETLGFTHVVAGGDDTFVANLLSEISAADALLVRLA